jgi:hypothetical protein
VQAQDIARSALRGVFRVLSNITHSFCQPLRRFFTPIAGNRCPHAGLHAQITRGTDDPRVAETERRTKNFRSSSDGILQRGLTLLKFVSNLAWSEPKKIGVRLRMVANQVAANGDLARQFRALAHKPADHKERRSGVIFAEEIEELRRDRRVGTIIKRKRQMQRRGGTAKRRPKKLRAWMYGAVRSDGCDERGGSWKADQRGIHCSDLFRSAQGLQVNSQLLAFLVEMAAFEAQGARDVGHVEIVTADLSEQDFFFERLRARSQRSGGG